jgi:hypothetical protein
MEPHTFEQKKNIKNNKFISFKIYFKNIIRLSCYTLLEAIHFNTFEDSIIS